MFDKERTGTGTQEWAEVTENICRGCQNGCLYCYAAYNANRFGMRKRSEWTVEELTKRAAMRSCPAGKGVVMFPSSHDITLFNIDQYIRVARLILARGNNLLIVTKPRRECLRALVLELNEYKEQILFRFTIGTTSDEVSRFWEPFAPLPAERMSCLALAYACGFRTSVSIEPMLEGTMGTWAVISCIRNLVTDTIWIGKMNKPRLRVDMSIPQNAAAVRRIEEMQSDREIMQLYAQKKNDEKIRWKDSIKDVVARFVEAAA